MANVIERLEELAALTPGSQFERVNGRKPNPDSWADRRDVQYAAISIENLVGTAARNALPDLLKVARAAHTEHLKLPWHPDPCEMCDALVALFGEGSTS